MQRYVFRRPTDFRARLALRVALYPAPAAGTGVTSVRLVGIAGRLAGVGGLAG